MRAILTALLLTAGTPALADECGDLIDRVASETKAEIGNRSLDFANFTLAPDTTLTLACGTPSSVGAQFRGEKPPEAYFALFGRAGHAVTGIDAATIEQAAHTARDAATRLRHSNVDAGGARVTCSVTTSEKGPFTLCAVIEHSDRS
ncbi:ABC transporter ATPase [Methylobacterium nigriterrae]|uniref:ABC transporter ATPase n=1 Tax=Methylobacterium nigriterrae TaxID=3127512 RepID=UPI003013DD29